MSIIASENAQEHKTTCPYCGVGCGVSAVVAEDGTLQTVRGLANHPANRGRLCVKGSALHETLSPTHRLLSPMVNGEQVDWDSALTHVASRWQTIVDTHGPDAVAFYLSGQLLTEDYYVANKLMKGFVGTANIDTNSRLCMASAVVAHKRAFGSDAVPGCYDDLEQCDVLLLVGSNTAYAHPIVYQRIVQAKKQRPFQVIVLDPRRTATCDIADLHIALRPGSDAFLFNGLLSYLAAQGALNTDYIQRYCDGFDEALQAAQAQVPDLETAAELCDVRVEDIEQVYRLFANNDKVVTVFSQGINQSSSGVDKGNAIINCHLATGKIGLPGAAPFSITGQPNAMGGREVGGLANQFAAHMGFTEDAIERVRTFWQAPNVASKEGLKAVDMFRAVEEGKVKAIWIMATNPVVSMPEADRVKAALEKCELVIVSDCMANTDTGACADVLLPATSWSEKHGTVTNSERCISLQKGFLPAPGQARHDWQIICDFAKKLGHTEAFDYSHPVEIFREHAALSGLDNQRSRAFNISGLADISLEEYENFTPRRWPLTSKHSEGTQRLFTDGHFFTANRRAKLIPITAQLPKKPPAANELIMNTGRIRDQWHTMTRTGKAPRLLSHTEEPYVQLHPEDAARLSISEGALVELRNIGARFLGRAKISTDQRLGDVFVPMHWNRNYASSARADALVNAITDPYCGQPEFKHSPVSASAYPAAWYGLLLATEELTLQADYWVKTTLDNGYKFRLADTSSPENWLTWLQEQAPSLSDWISLSDSEHRIFRAAAFAGGRLALYFAAEDKGQNLPDGQWLSAQLHQEFTAPERYTVLAGTDAGAGDSCGAMICSCFQVGENTIRSAIAAGCNSTEALGKHLRCGTNCGSCLPELASLIEQCADAAAETHKAFEI